VRWRPSGSSRRKAGRPSRCRSTSAAPRPSPAFREAVVAALRETWQRDDVDFLVNNAGRAEAALFQDTTEAMFDRLAQVLLKGPYFLTQTLLPLLADGGAIVNTSSDDCRWITAQTIDVSGGFEL
jgi:NAD(P)-dependent dehydrogenase (short-subunit alcohol dehydrogenase family)